MGFNHKDKDNSKGAFTWSSTLDQQITELQAPPISGNSCQHRTTWMRSEVVIVVPVNKKTNINCSDVTQTLVFCMKALLSASQHKEHTPS